MPERGSVWARRFLGAAIVQGAIAWIITVLFLYMDLPWSGMTTPAAVVAFGQAGTWLTVGYIGYLLLPVLGSGVSALFYHYIEAVMNRPYAGRLNGLAWTHLLLGNVGLGLGLGVMIYGGYVGGAAMVPTYLGGGGQSAQWVHEHVLGPLAMPIAASLIIGSLGPLFGGIGYAIQMRRRA